MRETTAEQLSDDESQKKNQRTRWQTYRQRKRCGSQPIKSQGALACSVARDKPGRTKTVLYSGWQAAHFESQQTPRRIRGAPGSKITKEERKRIELESRVSWPQHQERFVHQGSSRAERYVCTGRPRKLCCKSQLGTMLSTRYER